MDAWPFYDPPNVATFTQRQIVDRELPILLVCHDGEEGDWHFLSGKPIDMADMMIVGLGEMVKREPSLAEFANLPLGWKAWRDTKEEDWQRAPDPATESEEHLG